MAFAECAVNQSKAAMAVMREVTDTFASPIISSWARDVAGLLEDRKRESPSLLILPSGGLRCGAKKRLHRRLCRGQSLIGSSTVRCLGLRGSFELSC